MRFAHTGAILAAALIAVATAATAGRAGGGEVVHSKFEIHTLR